MGLAADSGTEVDTPEKHLDVEFMELGDLMDVGDETTGVKMTFSSFTCNCAC